MPLLQVPSAALLALQAALGIWEQRTPSAVARARLASFRLQARAAAVCARRAFLAHGMGYRTVHCAQRESMAPRTPSIVSTASLDASALLLTVLGCARFALPVISGWAVRIAVRAMDSVQQGVSAQRGSLSARFAVQGASRTAWGS